MMWFFDFLSFFIAFLGARGQLLFAQVLAVFSFDVLRVRRSVMLSNLKIAFGDTYTIIERRRIARLSAQSFFLTSIEFLSSRWVFPKCDVTIENGAPLHEALKTSGAYVMCIHMGNWELMCSRGATVFAPASVVVKEVGKGAFSKWVTKRRLENGMSVIDRKGAKAALEIIKTIRDGRICGFIVDQKRPGGEVLPLFGQPALTNTGLVQLAMRRPAPIMPCVLFRTGLRTFRMVFLDEFVLEKPSEHKSREEVVTDNATQMNRIVEQMIRLCPEQYFWMHNRWKL